MTLHVLASVLYVLVSFSTFNALDTRTIWEPDQDWTDLVVRVLFAAIWPLVWILAIINKLTYAVLRGD